MQSSIAINGDLPLKRQPSVTEAFVQAVSGPKRTESGSVRNESGPAPSAVVCGHCERVLFSLHLLSTCIGCSSLGDQSDM